MSQLNSFAFGANDGLSWRVFRLSSEQRNHLLALNTDEKRLEYIQEHIEAAWDPEHLLETDKAWDAIHRCLTDGGLTISPAVNPLARLILGGKQLYSDHRSYIVNLVEANELPKYQRPLKRVTKQWMKERYEKLRDTDYPQEVSSEDWEYTWEYFSGLPEFISRAQEEERSVIFTVDQ